MLLNRAIEFIYSVVGVRQHKIIDLEFLSLIRDAELCDLGNANYLEKSLLPRLGLNDEQVSHFPSDLHNYCGRGVYSWQYPNQFSKYLSYISRLKIQSYLEIGVRHGGTFLITYEYLSRFNEITKAIAVDLHDSPVLRTFSSKYKSVEFLKMDSHSSEFHNMFQSYGMFDLVMIDGNHLEEGCRRDFNAVKEHARVIVFHDISSDVWKGVGRVWKQIREEHKGQYTFKEYTEQYCLNNRRYMGIGVAINKKAFIYAE